MRKGRGEPSLPFFMFLFAPLSLRLLSHSSTHSFVSSHLRLRQAPGRRPHLRLRQVAHCRQRLCWRLRAPWVVIIVVFATLILGSGAMADSNFASRAERRPHRRQVDSRCAAATTTSRPAHGAQHEAAGLHARAELASTPCIGAGVGRMYR